ncbi:uncharacterized protein [Antedon mediterranea]|uniref:uncharacterized protein isoform X2 n=1 Tax=Antedon mediterranea TaxID=105859 RepID=UPI003AF45121
MGDQMFPPLGNKNGIGGGSKGLGGGSNGMGSGSNGIGGGTNGMGGGSISNSSAMLLQPEMLECAPELPDVFDVMNIGVSRLDIAEMICRTSLDDVERLPAIHPSVTSSRGEQVTRYISFVSSPPIETRAPRDRPRFEKKKSSLGPDDCFRCQLKTDHSACERHKFVRVGGGFRHSFSYIKQILDVIEDKSKQQAVVTAKRLAKLREEEEHKTFLRATQQKRKVKTYVRTKSGKLIKQYVYVTENEYQEMKTDDVAARRILGLSADQKLEDFVSSKKKYVVNEDGAYVEVHKIRNDSAYQESLESVRQGQVVGGKGGRRRRHRRRDGKGGDDSDNESGVGSVGGGSRRRRRRRHRRRDRSSSFSEESYVSAGGTTHVKKTRRRRRKSRDDGKTRRRRRRSHSSSYSESDNEDGEVNKHRRHRRHGKHGHRRRRSQSSDYSDDDNDSSGGNKRRNRRRRRRSYSDNSSGSEQSRNGNRRRRRRRRRSGSQRSVSGSDETDGSHHRRRRRRHRRRHSNDHSKSYSDESSYDSTDSSSGGYDSDSSYESSSDGSSMYSPSSSSAVSSASSVSSVDSSDLSSIEGDYTKEELKRLKQEKKEKKKQEKQAEKQEQKEGVRKKDREEKRETKRIEKQEKIKEKKKKKEEKKKQRRKNRGKMSPVSSVGDVSSVGSDDISDVDSNLGDEERKVLIAEKKLQKREAKKAKRFEEKTEKKKEEWKAKKKEKEKRRRVVELKKEMERMSSASSIESVNSDEISGIDSDLSEGEKKRVKEKKKKKLKDERQLSKNILKAKIRLKDKRGKAGHGSDSEEDEVDIDEMGDEEIKKVIKKLKEGKKKKGGRKGKGDESDDSSDDGVFGNKDKPRKGKSKKDKAKSEMLELTAPDGTRIRVKIPQSMRAAGKFVGKIRLKMDGTVAADDDDDAESVIIDEDGKLVSQPTLLINPKTIILENESWGGFQPTPPPPKTPTEGGRVKFTGIKKVLHAFRKNGEVLQKHLDDVLTTAEELNDYKQRGDKRAIFIDERDSSIDYISHFRLVAKRKLDPYGKAFVVEDDDFNCVINLNELKGAIEGIPTLQTLKPKQLAYALKVLNIDEHSMITFKMFSVMAALGERMCTMDPISQHLIDISDLMDIERKMELYKAMFYCNVNSERSDNHITSESLQIELRAGGLNRAQEQYVMKLMKPNEYSDISFIDYMAYIPLFLSMHENIIDNPLNMEEKYTQKNDNSQQRDMNPLGLPLRREFIEAYEKKQPSKPIKSFIENGDLLKRESLTPTRSLPRILSSKKGSSILSQR